MKNVDPSNNPSTNSSDQPKRSGWRIFFSAQIAAFIGTVADFLSVIILTEFAGLWYVYSNVIGASLGAVTNFLMGRYWVFSSTHKKIQYQAFRYFLVATGSMLLNTFGVWFLTEFTELHYVISKVLVSIFIGFTFNFFLQKYFVFK